MNELVIVTSGGVEDGWWTSTTTLNGSVIDTESVIRCGGFNNYFYYGYIRFSNINIPIGSRIVNAKITLNCTANLGLNHRAYFVKQADAALPAIVNGVRDTQDAKTRPKTTSYASFVSGTLGQFDITGLENALQEVINLNEWVSGNHLMVYLWPMDAITSGRSNFSSSEANGIMPTITIQYAEVNTATTSGGAKLGGYSNVKKYNYPPETWTTTTNGIYTVYTRDPGFTGGVTANEYRELIVPPNETINITASGGVKISGKAVCPMEEVGGGFCKLSGSAAPQVVVLASGGAKLSGDVLFPTIVQEQEASSTDDGEWSNTYLNNSDTEIRVSATLKSYIRFPSVSLPKREGLKISNARLIMRCTDAQEINIKIEGVKSLNPISPTTHFDAGSRPRTITSSNWASGQYAKQIRTISPDLSPIIQEIVDQTGWTENNSIMLYLSGTELFSGSGVRTKFATFDYTGYSSGGRSPYLEIWYNYEYVETSSGGVKSSGTSQNYRLIVELGDGKAKLSGEAEVKNSYYPEGGVKISGISPAIFVDQIEDIEGGVKLSATAEMICIKNPDSSGKILAGSFGIIGIEPPCSGGAIIVNTNYVADTYQSFNFTTTGGTKLSGLSIDNEFYNMIVYGAVEVSGHSPSSRFVYYTKVKTGIGRTFNNDNLIKDIEESLRSGNKIFISPQYGQETPVLESGYRIEHYPSWCEANSKTNQCDGIVPAIVKRRQGQYMPAKDRWSVRDRTIARFT